jgi:hypothetical protein
MSRSYALFTADGRLGNQLFQAAFLDSVLQPGDRVFTTGLGDFLTGFDWTRLEVSNTGNSETAIRLKRWARRIGKLAVRLHLASGWRQHKSRFNSGGQSYELHGGAIEHRVGLLPRLIYVDKGYFQDASLASHASFRLKENYLAAAHGFLATLPPGPRAFLHVRRGDYKKWEILGRSPLLDLRYFQSGIDVIKKAAPETQFILLSDEVAGLASAFADSNLHVFSGANVYEDFGMMTLCDGGVISNSTLSWWGGFFCGRKLPVVSPRGFLATGLGYEYPVGITADWMTPIDA